MSEEQVKALRDIATELKSNDTARKKELEMLEKLASTLKQMSVKLGLATQKRGGLVLIQDIAETLGRLSDGLQAFVEGESTT